MSPGERHEIRFIANPTQHAFITSKAKADLFSCRMGEGKSAALAWAIYYHTRQNPGATWALIRDTWENLRDTTQKEFFLWFPPGVAGEYLSSAKTFRWKMGELRGEVMFLGMDDPKDAAKLQSRPLAGFGMDEPAPAAESGGISEFVFDTGMTRLRQRDMKWYAAKLAQNNPDETHWTYRRFVDPETRTQGFELFQTVQPENTANLPKDYYADMAEHLRHRPDLVRRFVEGKFGFQQAGRPVTPQWSDAMHLADRIEPVPGVELALLWDFGLNPTCILTQVSPLGHWNILESHVGSDIGTYELISQVVKPVLAQRYPGFRLRHIGDPSGEHREQSSSRQSAVRVIRDEIGGPWRGGPTEIAERVDPLAWVLSQMRNGTGLVRVDKRRAKHVHHALRGGWHHHVARTGIVSSSPSKNIHSHPGDAMGYGAAVLFPMGRLHERRGPRIRPRGGKWWGGLGFERPGFRPPRNSERLEA